MVCCISRRPRPVPARLGAVARQNHATAGFREQSNAGGGGAGLLREAR